MLAMTTLSRSVVTEHWASEHMTMCRLHERPAESY